MSVAETLELQEVLYTSKNPTRRWLHCTRRDWIIDAINRYSTNPDGRAIEIGPGSGVYLPELARHYRFVDAADIADEFLTRARELANIHDNISAMKDDITDSKIGGSTYDLVLCTEVVEHVANSSAAIKHMYRVLKPGGVLILSTPQRYSTLELTCKIAFLPVVIDIVRAIYGEAVLKTGHINLLTADEARSQITDAGFSIRETFKSGLYLPVISEFAGDAGLSFEKLLEKYAKKSGISGLLWTQYYVATRV
jgi:2-polyprenyl-3-methyl-5-hydroxy-6-metoxy-1,4-benzoquinol methylase